VRGKLKGKNIIFKTTFLIKGDAMEKIMLSIKFDFGEGMTLNISKETVFQNAGMAMSHASPLSHPLGHCIPIVAIRQSIRRQWTLRKGHR
jgi:hypothetical protein